MNFLEIDIPLLHIRTNQLHFHPVTNIHAFEPIEQPAFDGRLPARSRIMRKAATNRLSVPMP